MTRIFAAPRHWWRALRAMTITASLLGVAACGSDGGTGPKNNGGTPTVTGNYDLAQIDKGRLPQDIYHGPYFDAATHHFYNQFIVKVTGGMMELDELGHFIMNLDFYVEGDGVGANTERRYEGTYKVSGTNVDFQLNGTTNSYNSGTIQNGALSLAMDLAGSGKQKTYNFRVLR